MTDEPVRRDFVDLSPYLADGAGVMLPAEAEAPAVPWDGPPLVLFRSRPAPPSPLDGPGYLVIHRGELAELGPGDAVAIGRMPRGIAGGVDDWTVGTIAEVDGERAEGVT
jgi:hypothetical protein